MISSSDPNSKKSQINKSQSFLSEERSYNNLLEVEEMILAYKRKFGNLDSLEKIVKTRMVLDEVVEQKRAVSLPKKCRFFSNPANHHLRQREVNLEKFKDRLNGRIQMELRTKRLQKRKEQKKVQHNGTKRENLEESQREPRVEGLFSRFEMARAELSRVLRVNSETVEVRPRSKRLDAYGTITCAEDKMYSQYCGAYLRSHLAWLDLVNSGPANFHLAKPHPEFLGWREYVNVIRAKVT